MHILQETCFFLHLPLQLQIYANKGRWASTLAFSFKFDMKVSPMLVQQNRIKFSNS